MLLDLNDTTVVMNGNKTCTVNDYRTIIGQLSEDPL